MSSTIYKGYSAHVEFDPEDKIFVGRIAGINDVVGFHADTVEGLKAAFREAVDAYIEACSRTGKPPEKPSLAHAFDLLCEVPQFEREDAPPQERNGL